MTNLVLDFFLEPRCFLAVLAVGREREEIGIPLEEGEWPPEPNKTKKVWMQLATTVPMDLPSSLPRRFIFKGQLSSAES